MSSESIIGVEIRLLAVLIKSILDLGLEYRETKSLRTSDGQIHKVDLVVKDKMGNEIGIAKTQKGDYNIITDSGLSGAELKTQEDIVKKIRQRYTYNYVIDHLKKQGYIIAEEERVQNNTIKLVARKWS